MISKYPMLVNLNLFLDIFSLSFMIEVRYDAALIYVSTAVVNISPGTHALAWGHGSSNGEILRF